MSVMRGGLGLLVLILCSLVVVGCHRKGTIVGTWSLTSPTTGVFAFASDGTFERADKDSGNVSKGTYELRGDVLTLHESTDFGTLAEESYNMQWSDPDAVNLVFVPNEAERALLTGLTAYTLNLRRVNMDEHLPRGPVLNADDQCVQNVRQIAGAMIMYSQDFDGVWPLSSWENSVRPYVRTPEYLSCPVVVRGGAVDGYAYNEAVVGAPSSSMTSPMTTPVVFDSDAVGPSAVTGFDNIADPARHPKGDSVAYADGHVLSIKPSTSH